MLEDVLDGKVSVRAARERYGVAVAVNGKELDLDETRRLRAGFQEAAE